MVCIRQHVSSWLTVCSPPETVLLTQATSWKAHESYTQHPICHLNYFHFHISMYFLMPQINLHLRQIACPWLADPLPDILTSHTGLLQRTVGLELISIHHVSHLADWFTSGDKAPRVHDWERQIIKIQARSWQLKWRTSVSSEHWRSPWWLWDVKQWFNWWKLKDCPCAARGQLLVVCVCGCVCSHVSCINPLIAPTASGPEAKPLSWESPGLSGCLRLVRGSHDHLCDNVYYCKVCPAVLQHQRSRLR